MNALQFVLLCETCKRKGKCHYQGCILDEVPKKKPRCKFFDCCTVRCKHGPYIEPQRKKRMHQPRANLVTYHCREKGLLTPVDIHLGFQVFKDSSGKTHACTHFKRGKQQTCHKFMIT